MGNFHGKSSAFVALAVGAALMTGAAFAQTAAPATAKPPVAKPQKKATASVVVVTNSRAVALTELDATPSGQFLPKKVLSHLAPGKKTSVTVATDKDCVFDLHGAYADGSITDSTGVDLCKDKNVNLVE